MRLEMLIEMQVGILGRQSSCLFSNEPFEKRPVMTTEDFDGQSSCRRNDRRNGNRNRRNDRRNGNRKKHHVEMIVEMEIQMTECHIYTPGAY